MLNTVINAASTAAFPVAHADVIPPATASDYTAFQDATVPHGYDTAYGYFSRTNPEAFDFFLEPVSAVAEEHSLLLEQTWRSGLVAVEVEAPTAVRELGVGKTLAFPVKVLRRFYR